jgi:hypothetical protein
MADQQHTGDTWGRPIEGSRPGAPETETGRKAWARDQIRKAATTGKAPSKFRQSDISWAFGSSPTAQAELARLEEQATTIKAAKVASERRHRAQGQVRDLAERILRDQDRRNADRRMAAAVRLARERLGMPPIE